MSKQPPTSDTRYRHHLSGSFGPIRGGAIGAVSDTGSTPRLTHALCSP